MTTELERKASNAVVSVASFYAECVAAAQAREKQHEELILKLGGQLKGAAARTPAVPYEKDFEVDESTFEAALAEVRRMIALLPHEDMPSSSGFDIWLRQVATDRWVANVRWDPAR